ncbi:MAG: methyltransferase domain-containing protein [Candidatus Binataceae bacterium]
MLKNAEEVRQFGKQIDFGKTAADYGRHRAGFPPAFFERLTSMGILRPGIRALDLGTGTGTIARGLAIRGCITTGLDRSASLMAEAARLDGEAGVTVRYVSASAEATGFAVASFDLVTAGQCWHWFDRAGAAAEARRILDSGGRIVIAHFDWIARPGNLADATEKLIEKHNPKWNLGGGLGLHPRWLADLSVAGFRDIETFSIDLEVPYPHEAWRGRIRASAGIGASLDPDSVERFDAELAAILEGRFPHDSLHVLHRVFAAIGVAP